MSAILLVLTPIAGGAGPATTVRVTIGNSSCQVAPRTFATQEINFRIGNRSRRPAAFVVATKRATVAPGHTTHLRASLRIGKNPYVCRRAGRSIARGAITVTPPVAPSPEHRIAVRDVNGFGEFYDRTTGKKFEPRGNNYIRVALQVDTLGRWQVYHSTFIVGEYDPTRAEAALTRMERSGYNVVRVFLNNTCAQGCSTNMRTGEISPSYVANLVDFLRRARKHDVFVMLTSEWLGAGAKYDAIASNIPRDLFDNINLIFLTPQGIQMSIVYWQDLISELIRQHAARDAILGYSLWNEAHVEFANAPFTLPRGRVTTANGQTYDMASGADVDRMIDDAFVYYTDQVRAAILRVDSTALVTIGFWTSPNNPAGALAERSAADFVDIHPYPGFESLGQSMEKYRIGGPTAKPVVIGEMGAFKSTAATAGDAASQLVEWQRESCAYGIDGWLLWTWDTGGHIWDAVSDGGAIERALAPKLRPDPCA